MVQKNHLDAKLEETLNLQRSRRDRRRPTVEGIVSSHPGYGFVQRMMEIEPQAPAAPAQDVIVPPAGGEAAPGVPPTEMPVPPEEPIDKKPEEPTGDVDEEKKRALFNTLSELIDLGRITRDEQEIRQYVEAHGDEIGDLVEVLDDVVEMLIMGAEIYRDPTSFDSDKESEDDDSDVESTPGQTEIDELKPGVGSQVSTTTAHGASFASDQTPPKGATIVERLMAGEDVTKVLDASVHEEVVQLKFKNPQDADAAIEKMGNVGVPATNIMKSGENTINVVRDDRNRADVEKQIAAAKSYNPEEWVAAADGQPMEGAVWSDDDSDPDAVNQNPDPVADTSPAMWVSMAFVQGDEATELLDKIESEGPEAAIKHMGEMGYLDGEGEEMDDQPWGGEDETFEADGGIVLSWNTGLGYVGVASRSSNGSPEADEQPKVDEPTEVEECQGRGRNRKTMKVRRTESKELDEQVNILRTGVAVEVKFGSKGQAGAGKGALLQYKGIDTVIEGDEYTIVVFTTDTDAEEARNRVDTILTNARIPLESVNPLTKVFEAGLDEGDPLSFRNGAKGADLMPTPLPTAHGMSGADEGAGEDSENPVIARWQSGRGKYWVELLKGKDGIYWYRGNAGGGTIGNVPEDKAMKHMERVALAIDAKRVGSGKTEAEGPLDVNKEKYLQPYGSPDVPEPSPDSDLSPTDELDPEQTPTDSIWKMNTPVSPEDLQRLETALNKAKDQGVIVGWADVPAEDEIGAEDELSLDGEFDLGATGVGVDGDTSGVSTEACPTPGQKIRSGGMGRGMGVGRGRGPVGGMGSGGRWAEAEGDIGASTDPAADIQRSPSPGPSAEPAPEPIEPLDSEASTGSYIAVEFAPETSPEERENFPTWLSAESADPATGAEGVTVEGWEAAPEMEELPGGGDEGPETLIDEPGGLTPGVEQPDEVIAPPTQSVGAEEERLLARLVPEHVVNCYKAHRVAARRGDAEAANHFWGIIEFHAKRLKLDTSKLIREQTLKNVGPQSAAEAFFLKELQAHGGSVSKAQLTSRLAGAFGAEIIEQLFRVLVQDPAYITVQGDQVTITPAGEQHLKTMLEAAGEWTLYVKLPHNIESAEGFREQISEIPGIDKVIDKGEGFLVTVNSQEDAGRVKAALRKMGIESKGGRQGSPRPGEMEDAEYTPDEEKIQRHQIKHFTQGSGPKPKFDWGAQTGSKLSAEAQQLLKDYTTARQSGDLELAKSIRGELEFVLQTDGIDPKTVIKEDSDGGLPPDEQIPADPFDQAFVAPVKQTLGQ